jgi:hypothetical protein
MTVDNTQSVTYLVQSEIDNIVTSINSLLQSYTAALKPFKSRLLSRCDAKCVSTPDADWCSRLACELDQLERAIDQTQNSNRVYHALYSGQLRNHGMISTIEPYLKDTKNLIDRNNDIIAAFQKHIMKYDSVVFPEARELYSNKTSQQIMEKNRRLLNISSRLAPKYSATGIVGGVMDMLMSSHMKLLALIIVIIILVISIMVIYTRMTEPYVEKPVKSYTLSISG